MPFTYAIRPASQPTNQQSIDALQTRARVFGGCTWLQASSTLQHVCITLHASQHRRHRRRRAVCETIKSARPSPQLLVFLKSSVLHTKVEWSNASNGATNVRSLAPFIQIVQCTYTTSAHNIPDRSTFNIQVPTSDTNRPLTFAQTQIDWLTTDCAPPKSEPRNPFSTYIPNPSHTKHEVPGTDAVGLRADIDQV